MELAAIGIQENTKVIWIQDEGGRPVRVQLFSQSDRKNHAAGLFTAGNTLEEVNQCAHLEMFVSQFLGIKLILAVLTVSDGSICFMFVFCTVDFVNNPPLSIST